jgi:hypothetical protein
VDSIGNDSQDEHFQMSYSSAESYGANLAVFANLLSLHQLYVRQMRACG